MSINIQEQPMEKHNNRDRPLIGVFDLFTGKGGIQSVMSTLLPRLTDHYRIVAINPYHNQAYADRFRNTSIKVEPLVNRPPITPFIGGANQIDRVFRIARRTPWMLRTLSALHQWNRIHRPDVIYFNFLPVANLFSRALPRSGPRLVFHSHGHKSEREISSSAVRRLNARFDAVIAVSEITRQFLVRADVDPNRIEVVYNSVDADAIRKAAMQSNGHPLPNRQQGERVIVQVGALTPKKAPDLTIDAFAKIATRHRCQLWFCGDVLAGGDRAFGESLKRRVKELGLTDRIHFLGWRNDASYVQHTADIAILPSRSDCESFGLVLAEAMSLQKPCIGSDRGGIPEVISHQETGIVCPLNVGAFASAMDCLLAGPRLRTQMGKAGLKRVREHFATAQQQQKICNLLQRVIDRKP
ncbi:D-inositol 3-phosphate glycosyltransferase [Novipirellula aureliae]|uniref:D-inositol 3-phosphate glycosyltransferase n=1 Tax=Novipirellula aureliae TaxID=2527966 RepID=A0A5C6E1P6_9BACT|nr:glycosyltransferase family 4 protein [Novipirellula aureliae]TWU41296.1 D-inositol 3-phosphate glycosyltransferase [Novipirellula aureliae]